MISFYDKIKQKLLTSWDRRCCICNNEITKEDVENNNFVYSKSKQGERFCHYSCLRFRKRRKK